MRLDVAQRIASVSWDLPGQAPQLLLPEIEERRHDGGGPFLARLHSGCGILAADVGLDLPEPAIVIAVCITNCELSLTCSS